MNIQITPRPLNGIVAAIPSKSDAHRALICAALADRKTQLNLKGIPSKDIEATINCLTAMGARFNFNDELTVMPITDIPDGYLLNCGESGSTLRFILPVASALGKSFSVTGEGRLPERPIDTLLSLISTHGCRIDGDKLPINAGGKLRNGKFSLTGDISSQYVSGLLFALPLLDGDSRIELLTPLQSSGYVDMTVSTLAGFGVSVIKNADGFAVGGNQKYISPLTVNVEGDWSNAAFWLCAGALSGDVKCTGLKKDSFQTDKKIIDILKDMGAQVDDLPDGFGIRKNNLHAIEINAREIPDLVPVLSVIMSAAEGKSVIRGAGRLRLKESDRLTAVTEALNAIGADITEHDDSLEINGVGRLRGGVADSFNDHRIAMSIAVASVISDNAVTITNAQAVNKSYPTFFEDFNNLGGAADVI